VPTDFRSEIRLDNAKIPGELAVGSTNREKEFDLALVSASAFSSTIDEMKHADEIMGTTRHANSSST
jgi:hypothetical protein